MAIARFTTVVTIDEQDGTNGTSTPFILSPGEIGGPIISAGYEIVGDGAAISSGPQFDATEITAWKFVFYRLQTGHGSFNVHLTALYDATSSLPNPTLLLHRTTTQSINSGADTAVSWSSAIRNTGPSTWWESAAPTNIVIPFTGLYQVNYFNGWAAPNNGPRSAHLHKGGGTISAGNFVMGHAITATTSTEPSESVEFNGVAQFTAGDTYKLAAYQSNSGATAATLDHNFSSTPMASFAMTYLG